MKYKDTQNNIHELDSAEFEYMLPMGCVQISDAEADAILAPTQAELDAAASEAEARALAAFDTPLMQTMIETMIDLTGSTETPASLAAKIKSKHKAKGRAI